jgi:hypothetical protein
MNRQFNYIVSAFLIFFLLFTGWSIIEKLFPAKATREIITGNNEQLVQVPLSESAVKGQILFMAKCARCHQLFKESTGPGLLSAIQSGRWDDRQKFFEWIRDPLAFMKKDPYTRKLKELYGSIMQAFPDITREQTDNIYDYLLEAGQANYKELPIARQ